jgi:hypothetical protein
LLIVASDYVIRGGALTILISRNQTSDVKSPAKCHEWGKIGWPVEAIINKEITGEISITESLQYK